MDNTPANMDVDSQDTQENLSEEPGNTYEDQHQNAEYLQKKLYFYTENLKNMHSSLPE